MDRAGALAVLAGKVDEAALVRLAEAIAEACQAQDVREIDARLRTKAGRVRGARVAVVIGS